MIRHYYHVFADGHWQEPVREHVAAILASGLHAEMTIGVVGSPDNRKAARQAFGVLPVERIVEADSGWEQLTLDALHADDRDGPVLYAHSKGSSDPSPINIAWRRSMTRRVVSGWRDCLARLDEADAVGCHWLTKREWPTMDITTPFFGGNFWWARSDYLRTLPAPSHVSRWKAEEWLGVNEPRVFDLLPGWPSLDLCGAI